MNINPPIPSGYLRLVTVAEYKHISLESLVALAQRGAIPQAIYSKETRHYYVPEHFRIHIS